MSMAEVKVKQWGNSIGVIIPNEVALHDGIEKGDTIKIDIMKEKKLDGFGLFKGLPKFTRDHDDHEEF